MLALTCCELLPTKGPRSKMLQNTNTIQSGNVFSKMLQRARKSVTEQTKTKKQLHVFLVEALLSS